MESEEEDDERKEQEEERMESWSGREAIMWVRVEKGKQTRKREKHKQTQMQNTKTNKDR